MQIILERIVEEGDTIARRIRVYHREKKVYERVHLLVNKVLKNHFNPALLFLDYLKISHMEEKLAIVIMVLVCNEPDYKVCLLYKMVVLKV